MGEVKCARGLGHGKLLLFGEHAAVYGHPAVGLSLTQTTRAELALDGSGAWRILPGGSAESVPLDTPRLRELLGRFEQLLPELRCGSGGSLRIASDIPRSLGFGSSAALCAALASAFAALFPSRSAGPAVWELAHGAECLFHGTPSGIDTGLALLDGLLLFHPAPPALPRVRRLPGVDLDLVVGAVPRRSGSASLIRGLRERMEAGDRETAARLSELGDLARRAAFLLEQSGPGPAPIDKLGELGELVRRAQSGLTGLGLSSPELEEMLLYGRTVGALGGKLSGAGGGGAFFFLFPGREQARQAAERMRARALERGLPTAWTIRAFIYKGKKHGQSDG